MQLGWGDHCAASIACTSAAVICPQPSCTLDRPRRALQVRHPERKHFRHINTQLVPLQDGMELRVRLLRAQQFQRSGLGLAFLANLAEGSVTGADTADAAEGAIQFASLSRKLMGVSARHRFEWRGSLRYLIRSFFRKDALSLPHSARHRSRSLYPAVTEEQLPIPTGGRLLPRRIWTW